MLYYFHLELLESNGVLSGDMLLNKRAMSVDCGTKKLSVIDIEDNEDAGVRYQKVLHINSFDQAL